MSFKKQCFNTSELFNGSTIFDTNKGDHLVRIFPLQVSLNCVLSSLIQFVLKPLGETPVVGQIMAGLIVGQSGLKQIDKFQKVMFPNPGGTFIVETLGSFGCMIYIFLVGVKMDLSILMRSSLKERVIGISTFIFPHLLTVPTSYIIQGRAQSFANILGTDSINIDNLNLLGIAILASTSSFHVIACFLTDLKILNTELGRMAISASTISGILSIINVVIMNAIKDNVKSTGEARLNFIASTLGQVIFITLVLRQVIIWMIRRTQQGARVKNIYIFFIFLMVLGTGLTGELCGQHYIFGPMILGLAIPNGPPVGSALVDTLDSFTSVLFLPLYFCSVGFKVNVKAAESYHWGTVILFFVLGFLGKLIATLIPCLFYDIPLENAFMLGLTLSTLGIVDVHHYRTAYSSEVIEIPEFAVMVVFAVSLAGFISPIVHFFYNPSRRYIVQKKRTIQNANPNAELSMLVCVYEDQNVPTLVSILEASNPTEQSPIIIYLLHMVELMGRSTPLLITHKPHGNFFDDPSPSDHIINGFKIFERKYKGTIFLHPFTSITPFLSSQEDICTLAMEKRTSIIIIPFHKQWNIDGTNKTYMWRNANKRVLKQAPCSVGILIDRGVLHGARSVLSTRSTYRVAVIFLGDVDDREALCYAMRMAGNPNVFLTVYQIILIGYMIDDVNESMLDENMIKEYKLYNKDIEHNLYKEEIVKDGVEIISVIRTMENSYDLILVGRSHSSYYNLFSDFMEWNEYPELGFFGDMLASSDFKGNASVLVVQQNSPLQDDIMRQKADHSYTTNTWK